MGVRCVGTLYQFRAIVIGCVGWDFVYNRRFSPMFRIHPFRSALSPKRATTLAPRISIIYRWGGAMKNEILCLGHASGSQVFTL